MNKLALGHAFTCQDLFMNFPVEKLKMSPELCKEYYSDGSKRGFAASIWMESVRLIVNDIIENNIQFKLPTIGRNQAYVQMERTTGDAFKKAFKNGKWNDVDFITSNFSGYQIALVMESQKRPRRRKLIYLSAKDRDKITEHTNQGKQY